MFPCLCYWHPSILHFSRPPEYVSRQSILLTPKVFYICDLLSCIVTTNYLPTSSIRKKARAFHHFAADPAEHAPLIIKSLVTISISIVHVSPFALSSCVHAHCRIRLSTLVSPVFSLLHMPSTGRLPSIPSLRCIQHLGHHSVFIFYIIIIIHCIAWARRLPTFLHIAGPGGHFGKILLSFFFDRIGLLKFGRREKQNCSAHFTLLLHGLEI